MSENLIPGALGDLSLTHVPTLYTEARDSCPLLQPTDILQSLHHYSIITFS